jgi:hypothetical protein
MFGFVLPPLGICCSFSLGEADVRRWAELLFTLLILFVIVAPILVISGDV